MERQANQIIRRHPDGSIDTNYYLMRGRQARSHAAYHAASQIRICARREIERLFEKASVFLAAQRISAS